MRYRITVNDDYDTIIDIEPGTEENTIYVTVLLNCGEHYEGEIPLVTPKKEDDKKNEN